MNLPKELTTVTFLSKSIAMLLFITLPILAFIFGMNYQAQLSTPSPTKSVSKPTVTFSYKCPKNDYVDCMPGPGTVRSECSPQFLKWAQENCPNFKGGAL